MPPRGRRRARAAREADDDGWDEVDEEIAARATRRKKSTMVAAAAATLGFITLAIVGVKAYHARTVPTPVPAPERQVVPGEVMMKDGDAVVAGLGGGVKAGAAEGGGVQIVDMEVDKATGGGADVEEGPQLVEEAPGPAVGEGPPAWLTDEKLVEGNQIMEFEYVPGAKSAYSHGRKATTSPAVAGSQWRAADKVQLHVATPTMKAALVEGLALRALMDDYESKVDALKEVASCAEIKT